MGFRSRVALTLATLGVLVAIVRACLRPAAHPEAQHQPAICAPALAPRVALVVVDALRADTFFGDAFASLRRTHPAAATGLVRTSPVSMSTAGVRSMATGTFPDLFDVLHNWDNVAPICPAYRGWRGPPAATPSSSATASGASCFRAASSSPRPR